MQHLTEAERRKVITLRTKKTEAKYAIRRAYTKEHPVSGCVICKIPTSPNFPPLSLWRVVENEFPYDKFAQKSYLFMPKRCVQNWSELTPEEVSEWHEFRMKMGDYGINFSMWSTPVTQSVPLHYHEHLIQLKTVSAAK